MYLDKLHHHNSSRKNITWLLFIFGILLIIFATLILRDRSIKNTPPPQEPPTLSVVKTTLEESISPEQNADDSIRAKQKEIDALGPQKPHLPCLKTLSKYCYLQFDDPLFTQMGYKPYTEGTTIDGQKVIPEKILFQVTFDTYNDEPITDVNGTKISTTQKQYDPKTKTLLLYIGIPEDYYRLIGDAQRNDLYMSQIVRSFFVLSGKDQTDFTDVFRIVNKIDNWYPEVHSSIDSP